tara:strand:- start:386 stop:679 length:294 start_codon:yes stop_codon:yes gene_type:complete
MLLECHVTGALIDEKEAQLLDIELYTQIASIKLSRNQGCLEIAPDHICKSALVCKGSFWITCLAAVLDQIIPAGKGQKTRGSKVFDELVSHGYVIVD